MLTEIIAKKAVSTLFDVLKSKINNSKQQSEDIRVNINKHLVEVTNWTSRIQFYGMSSAESTDESTISLNVNSIPRKFRGNRSATIKSETSLLESPYHYMLLGDPGSGKTTTIKRLARRLLLEDSNSTYDTYQYPLVIRLREIDTTLPFVATIANTLGLKYKTKESKIHNNASDTLFVGDEKLSDILPIILNVSKALLFIDGLDEVQLQYRSDLDLQIVQLVRNLTDCKVIVSCRSGDYMRHMGGFEIVEICPLDYEQVQQVCCKWLKDPSEFLSKLDQLPAKDLLDRPLFLAQMMVVYNNAGYLPEQPCALYRRVIRLMLEDWDEKRGIRRLSKYGAFDSEQKMEFLAALSYHLTCVAKVKRFSTDLLIDSYKAIRYTFSLPEDQAKEVVTELETHTGIIVESGAEWYEFTHLSLQEYLCAYYLVREPFAEKTIKYFREYPAPLAVAVALSANPSNWFANLILHPDAFGRKNSITSSASAMESFLSRLCLERPYFTRYKSLGMAILRLIYSFGNHESPYLKKLIEFPNVKDSVLEAMKMYKQNKKRSTYGSVLLEIEEPLMTEYGTPVLKSIQISNDLYKEFIS